MLTTYTGGQAQVTAAVLEPGQPVPLEAVWIDLSEPTAEEVDRVEAALNFDVPTREEMQEIEATSRLYRAGDALIMTATVIANADTDSPQSTPVTFILLGPRLISLRYADPKPFRSFAARLQREPALSASCRSLLIGLLEAIIDRMADILEQAALDIDRVSQQVFQPRLSGAKGRRAKREKPLDFNKVLLSVGHNADLTSKVRESLVTLGRLVTFLTSTVTDKNLKESRDHLKAMIRDIQSLSDHVNYLSNKINFLLDATLGMINIQQTDIIKIFSVVAVVFLPPTLIASIYGMNFDIMPELHWEFGYPLSLGMMVISALVPLLYFKWRGWL